MSNWFAAYADSTIGRALIETIDTPERVFEFRLLSELGKPAIQAIAKDVLPIIVRLRSQTERNQASQFCGWYVGQYMREAGFEIIRERGRVVDAPFQTGAVWRKTTMALEIVDIPPPLTKAGRIELGVSRDKSGIVRGRWLLSISGDRQLHRIHEIRGINQPIEDAYRDAIAYAKRLNVPVLWINDKDRLFPKRRRRLLELQMRG